MGFGECNMKYCDIIYFYNMEQLMNRALVTPMHGGCLNITELISILYISPDMWAMRCLLWVIYKKITVL